MINIEAINRMDLSRAIGTEGKINICWMMAANNENTDTLKYRNHTHNFFETHIVLSGHISYGFDDSTVTVKNGEYIIISPMIAHRVAEHSDDFIKLTVAFEAEGDYRGVFCGMEQIAFALSREMQTELDALGCRAVESKGYSETVAVAVCFKLLMLIMEANAKCQPKGSEKVYDCRVQKAKRLIDDNPSIFFTASEIANYCGISLKQLGRLFYKYEAIGVLPYIHEKKTEAAKTMIAERNDPFEVISRELGFSDVSYFNKFFLKNTGVTPGEYRKDKLEL